MNGKLNSVVKVSAVMLVAAALVVGLSAATATSVEARGGAGGQGGPGGQGGQGGQALGPLSAAEVDALTDAINEEYLALNTYQAVMAQYGSIEPFNWIATSEQRHADSLARLFTKYGLAVPANSGLSPAPTWTSVAAACQTGVDAEIADAALYDTVEPGVAHSDILRVFGNLQSASLEKHLPAFEACN